MKAKWIASSLLAFAVALTGATSAHALQGPPPPPGWDAPPPSYRTAIERRGFHDGIIGARKDWDNHRQPNPMNRDEYRRPNVPPPMWRAYRRAFRDGYNVGVRRFYGPRRY